MARTSQLGTSTMRLGTQGAVLAAGSSSSGGTSFIGIAPSQVGPEYDFALGYDPGTGTAQMVGYMIAEGGTWEESTQLQDVEKLIQTSTATTNDRDLTRWPKVVQGDWSLGERQLVYTNTTRYYKTDGNLDITRPGSLTVLPSAQTAFSITGGFLGGHNRFPLATDGDQWYMGCGTGQVIVGLRNGSTQTVAAAGTGEVIDLIPGNASVSGSGGVWAAYSNGIWFLDANALTWTQWMGGDTVDPDAICPIAYVAGNLFYINSGRTLKYVSAAGSVAGTTASTSKVPDGYMHGLCATPNGLMYAMTGQFQPGTYPPDLTYLYTTDATGSSTSTVLIGTIQGQPLHMRSYGGVTYILMHLNESSTQLNYTLYTYNGSSLTIFDDLRYALNDFKASVSSLSSYMSANVYGDGRFVYLAWPGLQGLQLDLSVPTGTSGVTGVSRMAGLGLPGTDVRSHRIVRTRYHGYVDVAVNGSGGTVTTYNGLPASGQLITSYYDFSTPSLTKVFRSVDVDLNAPLSNGASVTIEFQADASQTWSATTINQTNTTTLTAYLTPNTRAKAIRFRITLLAPNGVGPDIRSYGIKANLGRVWRTTASCMRKQMTNTGQEDGQGLLARDLLATIQNAYSNAGKITMYVSSPNSPSGVETVSASLEDYRWSSSKPNQRSNEQGSNDIEGTVEMTFVESLS